MHVLTKAPRMTEQLLFRITRFQFVEGHDVIQCARIDVALFNTFSTKTALNIHRSIITGLPKSNRAQRTAVVQSDIPHGETAQRDTDILTQARETALAKKLWRQAVTYTGRAI